MQALKVCFLNKQVQVSIFVWCRETIARANVVLLHCQQLKILSSKLNPNRIEPLKGKQCAQMFIEDQTLI